MYVLRHLRLDYSGQQLYYRLLLPLDVFSSECIKGPASLHLFLLACATGQNLAVSAAYSAAYWFELTIIKLKKW